MAGFSISKNVGLIKCRFCQTHSARIVSRHNGSYLYVNEAGKRWQGLLCPRCISAYEKKRTNRGGIDDVPASYAKKGRASEWLAKASFERLGYSVSIGYSVTGPDLVINMGDKLVMCEVKSATKAKNCKNSLRVSSVSAMRKSDDLIAIVFPNGVVYSEPMVVHLNKCSSNGKRIVTELYRQYGHSDHFQLKT